MDKTGCPFNNAPPKIVNRKGFRDVMKLTSAERDDKVIIVADAVQVMHLFSLLLYSRGLVSGKCTSRI